MKKILAKKRAFGIVETMVAVGILVMVMGTSISLARYSVGASSDSQVRVVAYNLARWKIEEIRRSRDTNWMTSGSSWQKDWCVDNSVDTVARQNPNIDFTITINCTDVNLNNPQNDIKKAKITVAWQNRGVAQSVILETKLADWKKI